MTQHRPMNIRHEKFVAGVLEGKSNLQAAIDAGFSPKSAKWMAGDLMKREDVQAAIAAGRKRLVNKANYTQEVAFQEVCDRLDKAEKSAPNAVPRLMELKLRLAGHLTPEDKSVAVNIDISEILAASRARMLPPMTSLAEARARMLPADVVEAMQVQPERIHVPTDRDVDLFS